MIHLILTLAVIGILLWALNTYVPMDGKLKQIINIVVVICVVVWLLGVFGILDGYDVPVPTLHRH